MSELASILCDLGRYRIRFALKDTKLIDKDRVWERRFRRFSATEQPDEAEHPFIAAFKAFLVDEGINAEGRELRLSLPGEVTAGLPVQLHALPSEWEIKGSPWLREFGLKRVRSFNDAVAAFYSFFPLHQRLGSANSYVSVIKSGRPMGDGRLIGMSAGTGLASVGGHWLPVRRPVEGRELDDEDLASDKFWVPVPSEFGSTWTWFGDRRIGKILADLRADQGHRHSRILDLIGIRAADWSDDDFAKREFIVSGPGLVRLYHVLGGANLAAIPNILSPETVVKLARQKDAAAVAAVRVFCRVLARTVIDFGLTFTARSAIFLYGPVLRELGFHGLLAFGFVNHFVSYGRDVGYGEDVPIYLIRHPFPELVGINRFRDASVQSAGAA